jgi:uncharacterized protein (TIGR02466 family)
MIRKDTLFPIGILRVKFPFKDQLVGVDEELDDFFKTHDTLYAPKVDKLIGQYESTLHLTSVDASQFKSLNPLRNWLTEIQGELWKELGFADSLVMIDRSWANRISKSYTNIPTHLWPHVHGSTDMVATYYHKYPKGAAKIRFHNPAELQFGLTPQEISSVAIEPEEGELIVWPGYLWHSVDNHEIDDTRIVIGFHFNQASYSLEPKWNRVVPK